MRTLTQALTLTSIATAVRSAYNPLKTALSGWFVKQSPTATQVIDEILLAGDARPVQPGRCYKFDGVDDYVSLPHLTGAETIVSFGGEGVPSIAAGRLNCTAGTLWNVLMSDGTHLKCDEAAGATAFDSSGNGNHGTITNATLSTFHATDIDVPYSWQNEAGYSDGLSGTLIPRNEATPTQDVLGNPLQYTDRVPYNLSLVGSHCATFDGVDDYVLTPLAPQNTVTDDFSFALRFNLASYTGSLFGVVSNSTGFSLKFAATGIDISHGGSAVGTNRAIINTTHDLGEWYDYVLSFNGAAKTWTAYRSGVLVGSNSITAPIAWSINLIVGAVRNNAIYLPFFGSACNVKVFDRALTASDAEAFSRNEPIANTVLHYPMSEGAGTTIYDVSGNGNHGTAVNTTAATFWGGVQDVYHRNLTVGFTLSGGVKIPAATETTDVLGNPLTNPAGPWHNGAETKLRVHECPALRQADNSSFLFSGDFPNDISYADIAANIGDKIFADVSTPEKKSLLVFEDVLTGSALSKVKKFTHQ